MPAKKPKGMLQVGLPSSKKLLQKPGPGRPETLIGKYLIRPTHEDDSGWEMLKDDPSLIDQVHEKFLAKHEMPPALQPKYLRRPEVLTTNRGRNISKGHNKPRSRQT